MQTAMIMSLKKFHSPFIPECPRFENTRVVFVCMNTIIVTFATARLLAKSIYHILPRAYRRRVQERIVFVVCMWNVSSQRLFLIYR
jgi:hypothetical protein